MVIGQDAFLVELVKAYPEHKIAPGMQTAWLGDKELYYAAVHIFPTDLKSRKVVAKATEKTLQESIDACYRIWKAIKAQEDALAKDAEMTAGSH